MKKELIALFILCIISVLAVYGVNTTKETETTEVSITEEKERETAKEEPEEETDYNYQTQNNVNNDTQSHKITQAVINKCFSDAQKQFVEWLVKNTSKSLGDAALYSPYSMSKDKYQVQQTESSLTITFDMSSRAVADPGGPVYTVIANYSVEGNTISLFTFQCARTQ